jgi:hypothetical protein
MMLSMNKNKYHPFFNLISANLLQNPSSPVGPTLA